MATSRVNQGTSEDLILGERGEGEHVHGIVQRAFQRRERQSVLRCKEHVGVEKSDCCADPILQCTEEAFGLSACEHAQAGAGTPGAAAYINREVNLPKPVLDLAPLST